MHNPELNFPCCVLLDVKDLSVKEGEATAACDCNSTSVQ